MYRMEIGKKIQLLVCLGNYIIVLAPVSYVAC